MPIFHTTHARIGTLVIEPARTHVDAEGHQHPVPGLRIKLEPAWMPGISYDEKGEITQEFVEPGPEIIDTDNLTAENESALQTYWGNEWPKKFLAWLQNKGGEAVKRYGFTEGDPRPTQKIKVTLTREEYDAIMSGKKTQLPEIPAGVPSGAQKITSGTKTVGK